YPTLGKLAEHLTQAQAPSLQRVYERRLPVEAPAAVANATGGAEVRIDSGMTDHHTSESRARPEPIAIIGMSGRFPQARSVEAMWRLLREGKNAIEEIPRSRFDWRDLHPEGAESDAIGGRWLGAVPGVEEFDSLFFEISPREAQQMDPRQRLLLQEAWN